MTPERSAGHTIKLKIRELHAQLSTLTAALGILNGKRADLTDDDTPKKERRSIRAQFDAMMTILSAHKGRSLTPMQLRGKLRAKGQMLGDPSSVNAHLLSAVKSGYVLKHGDGYRASPTIQKMTQTAARKPAKARRVNGHAAPKHLQPNGNYGFVLKALRAAEGPQKGATLQAVANQLGASMTKDTAVYGFLVRAVREGMAKKSADGYTITEKGKAAE
jgi:hypothetical protein